MKFIAKAVTNDQFNAWVDTVKKGPNTLSLNAYNALVPPTEDTGVYYFSAVDSNLFNDIIMKYMGPDAKDMFGHPQKMSGMPGMSADQPMHNTETEEHHHA